MGDIPHERGSTTKTTLFNESNFAICHACFCSGHIASECTNTVKETKNKDFNVKSDNIKNEFSTFIASSSKESSNYNFDSKNNFDDIKHEFEFDEKCIDSFKNYFLKKEKSKLFIKVKNFEKNMNLLKKENIELSLKNENLEKEKSNLSLQIKYFENDVDILKREKSELSEKIENFEKDIIFLKQKLDDSNNKPSGDVVNANDDSMNFTSFVTTFKDNCEIFANNSDFEFTDDELTYDYDGNPELSYEEKFRDLLKDYVLKRKENSNLSYKINDLEKEVKFLKKCLGESEKKLEIQKFDFEDKLNNFQNNCLSSEKNLELLKIEFLEKLKNSQIKFLSCEKARKELEGKMSVLTSELEYYKNISNQFTIGSQGLDKLLNIGKSSKDRSGLGFDKASNVPSTSQTIFVKSTNKNESSNSQGKAFPKGQKIQNPRPSVHESNKNKFPSPRTTSKKFIPICHHCGIVGHIRPKCFKLLDGTSSSKTNFENLNFVVKKSLISKENVNSKRTNFSKSKFKTFDNNRDKSTRPCTSHNKFIPTCHHCGVIGHIRPKCPKNLKEKSNYETNLFKEFDVIVKEISKLRNGKDRRPIFYSIDSKRNPDKNVWVKKEVLKGNLNDDGSLRVFDISKIKILKRPSESNKLN